MKHLPRALNRTLLFLCGLILIATGAGLLLLVWWKPAQEKFEQFTSQIERGYNQLYSQSLVDITGENPQDFSWLTIAWVTIAILAIILCLVWIFSQGGGKVKTINLFAHHPSENDQDGQISAQLGFVDDLLKDALEEDRWIAAVKTTAWEVKKRPGIYLSVIAYKGAELKHLKERVDQAISRMDEVLGNRIPLVVHVTTNWRTTFQSAQRVDNG